MAAQTQSIPPKIRAKTPSLAVYVVVGSVIAISAAGAALYFFNPSSSGFYPVCAFHRLTGLNCPGCGGTRAAYALLHGNLPLALKDNALFVLLLPIITPRGAWMIWRKYSHKPVGQFFPRGSLWALLAVAIIFTVARNLPAFSFLSP